MSETHTHTETHTHSQTQKHTHTHSNSHTETHTHTHTHKHRNTHKHTHTQKHTHRNTHTRQSYKSETHTHSHTHSHSQWALIHHNTAALMAREHPADLRVGTSWTLPATALERGFSVAYTSLVSLPTIPTLLDLPPSPTSPTSPSPGLGAGGRPHQCSQKPRVRMDRYLRRRCRSHWARTWPPPPGGRAPCRCPQWPDSAGTRPE